MPAESCGEIKANEQGMAVGGRYWLKPKETKIKSKSFLVTKLLLLLKLDGQVRYVCDDRDQYQYLGNCPPTPPLTQH